MVRALRRNAMFAAMMVSTVVLCSLLAEKKSLVSLSFFDTDAILSLFEEEPPEVPKVRKLERIIQELKNVNITYYVYEDKNMSRPDIRTKAINNGKATWKFRWGRRFAEFSKFEVIFLEALEKHHLRTYNPAKADFYMIPIPLGALVYFGTKQDTQLALDALFEKELYKKFPEKHVAITNMECLFHRGKVNQFAGYSGWTMQNYQKVYNITLVKETDIHSWHQVEQAKTAVPSGYLSSYGQPLTKHGWSISFAGAAASSEYTFQIPTYEAFRNKTFHYFYHTRKEPSLSNSTQFRHAPVKPNVTSALIQPSSVGHDVPYDQWLREFANSKFCLNIRGDLPFSRSFFRAVRNGCIPVVVSEWWPFFSPVFRSFLRMDDYAIFVKERDFLRDPAEALNNATDLTERQIQARIKALALAQQIIIPDHPESLFVQAFCRETLASQQMEYYAFHESAYHRPLSS